MKSDNVKKGMQQAPHRSLFNALGYTKEELDRPLVGIVSSYNELGLTDINSTEGNKVKGENDMSSADVIIAIKTGQVVATVVLVITTIIILTAAVFIIRKFTANKGIL